MIRLASLVLAITLFGAADAGAARLEAHTDVARATITARDDAFAVSSPPPFLEDLPAGRYLLSVASEGRLVGSCVLDADRGITLRGSRWSRTLSSAVLPGSGQWRDDSWWSGAVVGGSVAVLLARALDLDAEAGGKRDGSDVGSGRSDPELLRLSRDARALEATRDDYLMLAGGFYLANVVDALVRRGALRFRETSPGVVTAGYEPTSVAEAALLSTVWPGLGQVRHGSLGRGRVWNALVLGMAIFWAEARDRVEESRSDRDVFVATNSPDDAEYFESLARLQSEVEEKKVVARNVVYVGVALWAYNIVDAALVARRSVADSGEMVRNDGEGSRWSVTPGLVGENAGLVLGWKF